jgi:hypothetical protein
VLVDVVSRLADLIDYTCHVDPPRLRVLVRVKGLGTMVIRSQGAEQVSHFQIHLSRLSGAGPAQPEVTHRKG